MPTGYDYKILQEILSPKGKLGAASVKAAEATSAAVAASQPKGMLGALKGGAGTSLIGTILAQLLISKVGSTVGTFKDIGLKRDVLKTQRESIDPEDVFMQALMPQVRATEQQATEALLSELTGMPMQSLVPGERMIGG
ncbi:hypothetical protein LCGC14_1619510 [marine sediment metagenome]|uniref:Uncharacterized protein n=1 Tax=marine sediment metagenome TaxID=412755 RepID=A0A0F9L5Y4_9ZZZZ